MGTHALTVMYDNPPNGKEPKEIAVLYRQMDGYVSGHGHDLGEFLSGIKVVNGIGVDDGKIANGGHCLAAQIVTHFKDDVGGFYLYPAGTRDEWYIYHVYPEVGKGIKVRLECGDVTWEGTPEELVKLEEAYDNESDRSVFRSV